MGLLEKQPRNSEYVVHYPRNAMYKQLLRMCEAYGLPHYRFHDLRHVQASVMLALGVPDKYAMERMGHASANMLKTVYQHTMRSKSEEVADKVDSFFSEKLHTDLHIKNKAQRLQRVLKCLYGFDSRTLLHEKPPYLFEIRRFLLL